MISVTFAPTIGRLSKASAAIMNAIAEIKKRRDSPPEIFKKPATKPITTNNTGNQSTDTKAPTTARTKPTKNAMLPIFMCHPQVKKIKIQIGYIHLVFIF